MSGWVSKLLGLALMLAVAPPAGAEQPVIAKQEIDFLIRYIGDSVCEFRRNGVWSDSRAAESHMRGKYDLMAKLGMIDTAKDFIDKAATKSSITGRAYEIRCAGGVASPSGAWLSNELARYRAPLLR